MQRNTNIITTLVLIVLAATLLSGCFEQYQITRTPAGALNNFLLHLQAGQIEDAKAYFAPGLVTPTPDMEARLREASERLRQYEIKRTTRNTVELGGGEVQTTISGRVRPRTPPGQPTPGPDEGWQDTDIITARMVFRGPGYRILDFELKCCPKRQ
jgi:hypothetical protein